MPVHGFTVTPVVSFPQERVMVLDFSGSSIASKTGGNAETPIPALPTRMGSPDIVFEATGAPSVIQPALEILGPNGVAILASVTGGKKEVPVDLATWNRNMVLGNRLVFGTVNAARRHFEAGARTLEAFEQRLPGWAGSLITRRLPFREARSALEKGPGDIKTVLEFS
jgi:threonine dehydrogenase-like Zn-dependent dehydrogenase